MLAHSAHELTAVHKVTAGGSLQRMSTQCDVNSTWDWHQSGPASYWFKPQLGSLRFTAPQT